jgi:hypothetical protein
LQLSPRSRFAPRFPHFRKIWRGRPDLGAEPAILGATDCTFSVGPGGEHFTVATSLVGSRTFPAWLRAMRRPDLTDDGWFVDSPLEETGFEPSVPL